MNEEWYNDQIRSKVELEWVSAGRPKRLKVFLTRFAEAKLRDLAEPDRGGLPNAPR